MKAYADSSIELAKITSETQLIATDWKTESKGLGSIIPNYAFQIVSVYCIALVFLKNIV